ncbi:MAG: metallophosphoesterase [Deltaproteobacteria bacterium]|nr:metallophosphoesterase [Deltaproteobacteria bacterium]
MEWKEWFSKRAVGAINLLRGRGKIFDDAREKIEALIRFKEANNIDLVINTGDYTALGLESELKEARLLVDPLMHPSENFITVPGNHDIYVDEVKSHSFFFEQFRSVLYSDMPEYCRGGHWPLIRLAGPHVGVIALNSARPNPWPWMSSGSIPQEQLDVLDEILADDRLRGRFIFIITHYAPLLADGTSDTRLHGIINAERFLDKCRLIQSGAILCGHVHQTYHVPANGLNCDIYCAGSAVTEGNEGFWVYEVEEAGVKAKRIRWNKAERLFIVEP